jgi:hypothetical protein
MERTQWFEVKGLMADKDHRARRIRFDLQHHRFKVVGKGIGQGGVQGRVLAQLFEAHFD